MWVLGIDSSTPAASVALIKKGNLVVEGILNIQKNHSKRLMPLIDKSLKEAGLAVHELGGIAVAIGPGSFTGLRIGLTTAKLLAWSIGKPILGIPTLDGLAYNAQGSAGIVCPILNARMGEVYTALYRFENGLLVRLSDYLALTPKELLELLRGNKESTTLLGDGVDEYCDVFVEGIGNKLRPLNAPNHLPRASQVAYLGWQRLKNNCVDDPFTLSPLYIRPSQAEIMRKKDRFKQDAPRR